MPSPTLEGFKTAVDILFKTNECAISLFGAKETDGSGDVLWLHDVLDPEALPSYWTLSTPGWYHPDMGNIRIEKPPDTPGVRSHHQDVCLDGVSIFNTDVFPEPSPFLVFEVDYLLIDNKNPVTQEIKKLQREAMAYAFRATGFPFAVLTDSGGKSIHATVRLDDDIETIKQWRASPDYDRLQDLAWVVFGHYDQGVMKQSGKARLVRTPGAIRDDGSPQSILATGQRVSIAGLMHWFLAQLNEETQNEVFGRQPITRGDSPLRQHYLRINKWRGEVMQPNVLSYRGEGWRYVTNRLIEAGCIEPKLLLRPSAQVPTGQWQASWLWHISAWVYNQSTAGWFFSQDATDWVRPDRLRWEGIGGRQQVLKKTEVYERTGDSEKNALVDQMMVVQAQTQAQQIINALPPPPSSTLPPPFVGGTTGATLHVDPQAGKKKKSSDPTGTEPPFAWVMGKLRKVIPKSHLIKLSDKHGGAWYLFDGKIWNDMSSDFARAFLARVLGIEEFSNTVVAEAYTTVERTIMVNEPWTEFTRAIAFQNGTLYLTDDGDIFFSGAHDPADRLRSLVPCHYDPQSACPRWLDFVTWALPDTSRASLLQEAFGYTLIPGQPFQSFFMFTGSGSNGKSVALAVLQAMHKDSFETVALANLGARFSLGTIGRKRLAIDTEAENVTNAVSGEGNSSTAILKSWTGGDPVKLEAKKVQGWSETINAKYFMSCNKKPRFVDPTKGVWRRLKLLKFESSISERQEDRQLGSKLITSELPGIVNWAIQGLRRLYQQNGFTMSDVLRSDLTEYQIDSDSVALFMQDFMRIAVGGSATAWFDIRPFHKAYKDRCLESGNSPVSETEFRQRLEMLSVPVGRPGEHETVNGCPAGTERAPGPQHWAIRGWRCYHPGYTTQTLMGNYAQSGTVGHLPHDPDLTHKAHLAPYRP